MQLSTFKKISVGVSLSVLAACSTPEPVFKGQKVGKPYEINGKIYRPQPDSSYDKIGDGSWYGPGFHGNRTASGEIFDEDDITAAHPTLPLPSLVKVTNMRNEKSVVVRINDRGPFHSNRIIDLSKRSAQLIDLKSTQPVRVQYLPKETEEYLASIQGASPKIDMVAFNEQYNEKVKQSGEELIEKMDAYASAPNFNREVEDYAPIQSVASNDIEPQPAPVKLSKSSDAQPPKSGNILISDAVANENSVYPAQPVLHEDMPAKVEKKPVAQESTVKSLAKPAAKPVAVAEDEPVKTSANGKYMILAGSFASEENARKLASSIGKSYKNDKMVNIDKVPANGKEWWRVNVGPFASREAASEVLETVQNFGAPDARIRKQ